MEIRITSSANMIEITKIKKTMDTLFKTNFNVFFKEAYIFLRDN